MRLVMIAVAAALGCGGSSGPGAASPEAELPRNRAAAEPERPGPQPEPEPERQSDAEIAELAIELLGQMGRAAADAGGACEPMASSLAAIASANAGVWQRLDEISSDPERRAAIESREEELTERLLALARAIGDCGADPGVQRALAPVAGEPTRALH